MSTALNTFNAVYEQIATDVVNEPIKDDVPAWSNGTGYYDHAVRGDDAPVLAEGEMIKALGANQRRMIIVGTRFGNVVVFERYTDRNDLFVTNMPYEIAKIFMLTSSGPLDAQDMQCLIGADILVNNVGHRLATYIPR